MTLIGFSSRAGLLKTIGFSVLLILGLAGPLYAQNQLSMSAPSSPSSTAFNEAQGHLSLRNESFISPDYKQTTNKSFSFIGGGVDTLSRARKESEITNGLHTQTSGAVSPSESVLSYLNISQLYWKEDLLVVGRRKEMWSNLDDIWNLGLYQPLFRWNPILPESQGLTGIFLQFHQEQSALNWGVVLFGSNIFIPNQEASFEVDNGKFVASNPYFGKRPTQARISGQTDDINYEIEKPNLEKVVFNRSFAGKAYLGKATGTGFLLQTGFAHKPANELALGIDAFATPNNSVQVNVLPNTVFHTLVSADMQYTWKNLMVGLAGVKENREDSQFDPEWTYTNYQSATLVSPYVKVRLRGFEVVTSYLDISGGEKSPKGNLANESKDFLNNRFHFGDSYLMKISTMQRLSKGQAYKGSVAYQQGVKNEYALITGSVGYQLDPRWNLSLAGQLIRVADNSSGEATTYSSFVNNDAASVGVQYVF